MLKLTKNDLKTFENDPIEYIRRQSDTNNVSNLVRTSAAELIDESCNI